MSGHGGQINQIYHDLQFKAKYPPSSLRSSVLEVLDRLLLALLSSGLLPLDIRPHGIHDIDASQLQSSLHSLPDLEESMFTIFLIGGATPADKAGQGRPRQESPKSLHP